VVLQLRYCFSQSFLGLLSFCLVAGVQLVSCNGKRVDSRQPPQAVITDQNQTPSFFMNERPLDVAQASTLAAQILQQANATTDPASYVWALANCQCARRTIAQLLTQLSTTPAALPQVLVPTVRQEIVNNPQLKTLQNLGGIGTLLQRLFANDNRISESVRKGLVDKMNRALPGGTRLSSVVPFRFDLFPSLIATPDAATQTLGRRLDISEQASIWALVFAMHPMWQGGVPIHGSDHGLQLLQTARTLAEWQYIYGLEEVPNAPGRHYGGLTVDLRQFPNGAIGAFDPRKAGPNVQRLMSGRYQVSYQDTGAVELATSVQETWVRESAIPSLDEQARLAAATAMAFERLRPERRGNMATLFGPEGSNAMFPDDAHQIALIHLSAFGESLSGGFIDEATRDIFANLQFAGANKQAASPLTLARLSRALALWSRATENVANARLDAKTASQLSSSSGDLKKASQAALQAILAKHFRVGAAGSPPEALAIVINENTKALPSMGEAAEILATLIFLEQEFYRSPLLVERLTHLVHWFAAVYLRPLPNQLQSQSPATMIWTARMLQLASQHAQINSKISWLSEFSSTFSSAISAWGGEAW
jgi:hypothetical protein